jgi:hypothetical protein
MLRHVAWLNEALVEPCPEGGLTSSDASVLRRCLIPARELENLGIECSVFGNLDEADPTQVSKHLKKLETDIVVIGKISEPTRSALARAAKHLGCYIIADFSHETDLSVDVLQLAEIADQIVVSTVAGADLIHKKTGASASVIPDCENDSVSAVTHLWLDCFKKLKLKPPASANSNTPE